MALHNVTLASREGIVHALVVVARSGDAAYGTKVKAVSVISWPASWGHDASIDAVVLAIADGRIQVDSVTGERLAS